MSVVVVGSDQVDNVRFGISPLAELISALNIVDDPSHHPHRELAGQIEDSLPPRTSRELERFAVLWRAFRCGMFLPTVRALDKDLGAELDALGRLDCEAFVEFAVHAVRGGGPMSEVRGVTHDATLQRRALAHARARGTAAVDLVDALIDDPARVQAQLCEVLASCHELFFAALWKDIVTPLRQEARTRNDMLGQFGVCSTLVAAVPSIRKGAAVDTVVIDKVYSARIDLQSTKLALVPTILGRPHTVVKDERDEPAIQYPIPDPRERPAPRLSVQQRRLLALSDPVCLQLCRDIAREARSTLQLAERWKLDPAVVSRHLKELRSADLVDTERQGHFVLYRLKTSELAHLGSDLLVSLLR